VGGVGCGLRVPDVNGTVTESTVFLVVASKFQDGRAVGDNGPECSDQRSSRRTGLESDKWYLELGMTSWSLEFG